MLLKNIKNNLANAFGYRTRHRYIVFESDDWGCLRMPSLQVYNELLQKWGLKDSAYNRYDSIENADDFNMLSDLLFNFRDKDGRHPVFTLNFNLANPDYEKIASTNFEVYCYETFIHSYQRVNGSDAAWHALNQSMEAGVFVPQFHGREHLQVEHWLADLRKGDSRAHAGFSLGFFGFDNMLLGKTGYLATYSAQVTDDIAPISRRITDGLNDFERIFQFRSRSFIAPQNTLHDALLPVFAASGVDILQGARRQKYTNFEGGITTRQRYTGKTNQLGQLELARNVTFEPSTIGTIDWVNKCLNEIEVAFFWHKPAIICTHRLNYLGGLSTTNRENGIQQLCQLLMGILKRWPDVKFTDSVSLANDIKCKLA